MQTVPPKKTFTLGMLLYDTRYRSMTIQIVALAGFMLLISWLISNTIQNLETLGKGVELWFLFEPSSYDINQKLIEYSSRSTHLRAAFVGLINTLIVAILGCITATVLGIAIGILRLSHNWIVAKIMTCWVEIFRNVPVLLWIVFTMAVLIESLPRPATFRGDNPESSLLFWDSVAITNRGTYLPEPFFNNGLGDISIFGIFEVSLDLVAFLIVLFAGIFVSNILKKRADKTQQTTGHRPLVWPYRIAVVVIPPIILLYILGFYLGKPELKGFNFQGGIYLRNSLIALWIALSCYTSAFIAEIVRAGILAVSKGQTEAAYSLGLRPGLTMNLIILPQALRVIIPPLISQFLNLTKNSSLAISVGYMDITGTLGGITLNQTGRELESILLLMLVFLGISLGISAVMNWYNSTVKIKER